MKQNLIIGWLYPELMSTYGDRGNIIVLQKRCEWREINIEIKHFNVGFDSKLLATCDLLFMGGAQDTQQQIVALDLMKKRDELKGMIEKGTPGLYICGAYQFLGKYYKEANGKIIKGLGILDLYTENPGTNSPRLIGNIAIKVNQDTVVGFENHGGRTYLKKGVKPFGKVIKGFGNNGEDQTEGAVYKNSFGTYLHGPILPKNPELTDNLIKIALEKKYGSPIANLSPLDNSLETRTLNAIAKRLDIKL
jgi:lipid II isoglutaminyl synthase (glutamine-hydrolysing)